MMSWRPMRSARAEAQLKGIEQMTPVYIVGDRQPSEIAQIA